MANLQPLKNFLITAYNPGEFVRLIKGLRSSAGAIGLDKELAQDRPLTALVDEGVELLERHGLVNDALFEMLETQRPTRIPEIRLAAREVFAADETDDEQEVSEFVRQRDAALAEEQRLVSSGQDALEIKRQISILTRRIRDGRLLQKGDQLLNGRYQLVCFEGRGGYGEVWSGFDSVRRRMVALKILTTRSDEDGKRIERFKRGARAQEFLASKLLSGVVQVLELPVHDGKRVFFVMEHMEGGNLRRAILQQEISTDLAISIVMKMGEVLHEAHELGYYHRDVKPHNILLDKQGKARLSDFDLVSCDESLTTGNGFVGTYAYAPDEALEGGDKPARTIDVYSLGLTTLFCMLGQDVDRKVRRNRRTRVAELSCSDGEKRALLRAIEDEPTDRFPTTAEFVLEFRLARKAEVAHKEILVVTNSSSSGEATQHHEAVEQVQQSVEHDTLPLIESSRNLDSLHSASAPTTEESTIDTDPTKKNAEAHGAEVAFHIWRVPLVLAAIAFVGVAMTLSRVMEFDQSNQADLLEPSGSLSDQTKGLTQDAYRRAPAGTELNKDGEICGNTLDDDCDGLLDEGCATVPTMASTESESSAFPNGVPIRFRNRCPAAEVALSDLGDSSIHFIRLPPGEFTMGGRGKVPAEAPQHQVEVSGFLLSDTEVTQRQWAETMKGLAGADPDGRSSLPDCEPIEKPGPKRRLVRTDETLLGDELPMHCVTWFEPVVFTDVD